MEFIVTEADQQRENPDVPLAPLQLRPLLDAQDPVTIMDTIDFSANDGDLLAGEDLLADDDRSADDDFSISADEDLSAGEDLLADDDPPATALEALVPITMPVCQPKTAVSLKAKQNLKIKKKVIGQKTAKHRSEPTKHRSKPANPTRGRKNSGNVCNMSKVTINPFFNFIRAVRQTRCGDQQSRVVHDAAVLWRGMTLEQKCQYTQRTVTAVHGKTTPSPAKTKPTDRPTDRPTDPKPEKLKPTKPEEKKKVIGRKAAKPQKKKAIKKKRGRKPSKMTKAGRDPKKAAKQFQSMTNEQKNSIAKPTPKKKTGRK